MENQGAQAGVGGVPGSGRARVGEGGVGPEAEKGVWGEEVAASIEAASAMLGELAGAYSIPQARIKIRVRMGNAKEGTLH